MLSLPFNKSLRIEVRQPRNPAFHRLFFALCKRIGDGIGKDTEQIATVFKYATGHYDAFKTKTYGEVKVPRSISFAKLDETAFRVFFDRCVEVALTEWGIDAASLADLLDPKTEMRA